MFHRLLVLPLLFAAAALAQEPLWQETFAAGAAGATPYHKEAPQAAIEPEADGGDSFLRITTPGARKLEGARVSATGLPGERVATVTARVRGQGEVWLCLLSRAGWLYSPATVALTDQWQEISLGRTLLRGDANLAIYFLSREVQQAVFEVDEVAVRVTPEDVLPAAAVGPWRIEAEDHALRGGEIVKAAEAAGGRAVAHEKYVSLRGLPFPRTSRPVIVQVKGRFERPDDEVRLWVNRAGVSELLATVKVGEGAGWRWVALPAFTGGELGEQFMLDARGGGELALDAVVLATEELTPAALDAAAGLFESSPIVTAGALTDAGWPATVAVGDFLGVRSFAPAEGGTAVRLAHDAEGLHFRFVCEEPILSVAQQRTHEFQRSITAPDGPVWQDDSVVILLDPGTGGQTVYDLFVNANGVIADARATGQDLWGSREVGWNSGAIATAELGDGVWSCEVTIPFAALGGPPKPAKAWSLQLGRIAAAREETTSWTPTPLGFHDRAGLGTLRFGDAAGGAEFDLPEVLEAGINRATVRLTTAWPRELLLLCRLTDDGGTRLSSHRLPAGTTGLVEVPFDLGEAIAPMVFCALVEAVDLTPIVTSPALVRRVSQARATLHVTGQTPWQLHLNGTRVKQGSGAEEVRLALKSGANVVVLEAQQALAVAVEVAGRETGPVAWKQAPSREQAVDPAADDASWPTVAQPGAAGPGAYRFTLLWAKTRQWPKPDPALFVAQGTNQHLTFVVNGLERRTLNGWTTWIAVPAPYELIGSTGYYGVSRDTQPLFRFQPDTETTLDGQPYRLARVEVDGPVLSGRHRIMSLFNAFVRCPADATAPESATFWYWSEANDGTVIEPRQSIPVRSLPPLNGAQPKRLMIQMWGSFFATMDDLEMRAASLETMRQAGVTDVVAGNRETGELARRYGITQTKTINFESWSINLQPYLETHPAARLINGEGEPNDRLACPTALLADAWSPVEARLREMVETERPNTLEYDYEYSPFTGPHSCYCEQCLAAFRQRAELPAGAPLDGATVRAAHDVAWVDFMAWQVARIMQRFNQSLDAIDPAVQFAIYSGYQTPDNPRRYGIDWHYIGELQACDHAGAGYGRPGEAVAATVAALNGIPLLCGALLQPYDPALDVPLTPLTQARLLRRFLDATGGALVYDRLPIDGRVWQDIAAISRLVAEFEPLFERAPRETLANLDPVNVQVLGGDGGRLLLALNQSSRPLTQTLPLPADWGAGRQYYTGEILAAGATVACELAPGGVAVYVFER